MPDRCPSSVCWGDYVCCLDAGHEGEHVARKFGSRHGSVWTSWDDHDADDEDYACSHTETELIEGKPPDDGTLWRCTVCGDVLKEVHDPNGTTWVDSIPHGQGRKVRYVNLTQTLAHIKPSSAVTETVEYAPIALAGQRDIGPGTTRNEPSAHAGEAHVREPGGR